MAETDGPGTTNDNPKAAGAILAGGLATRMGGSKCDLVLEGMSLIERVVTAFRAAGIEPSAVTRCDRPVGLEHVTTLVEPDGPRHPLAGVAMALRESGGRPVVVVACDMPLVTPALLRTLANRPGGTLVPAPRGRLQPLAARYDPGDLPMIEAALDVGRSVRSLIAELEPEVLGSADLEPLGDPDTMFFNVNEPADLDAARVLLDRAAAGS
jgi:molybdopterin-guanine dinucleotide biosynthesis protein A